MVTCTSKEFLQTETYTLEQQGTVKIEISSFENAIIYADLSEDQYRHYIQYSSPNMLRLCENLIILHA